MNSKLVYSMLLMYAQHPVRKHNYRGLQSIAADLKISIATVKRCMGELRRVRLLDTKREGLGMPSTHTLNLIPRLKAQTDTTDSSKRAHGRLTSDTTVGSPVSPPYMGEDKGVDIEPPSSPPKGGGKKIRRTAGFAGIWDDVDEVIELFNELSGKNHWSGSDSRNTKHAKLIHRFLARHEKRDTRQKALTRAKAIIKEKHKQTTENGTHGGSRFNPDWFRITTLFWERNSEEYLQEAVKRWRQEN
jgi:hypothetical protein